MANATDAGSRSAIRTDASSGYIPESRPPLSPDDKEMMLAHILRFPDVFQTALRLLKTTHFDVRLEAGYALIWETLQEFWKQYNELPGRDVLLTLLARKLDIDPTCMVEEAKQELQKFVQYVFDVAIDDLMPQYGVQLIREFLEERETNDFRYKLRAAGDDVPVNMPRIIKELNDRFAQISRLQYDSTECVAPDGYSPKPLAKHKTGVDFLDKMLNGGQAAGEVYGLLGATGVGKAQPLVSLIQTPTGPKMMGHIEVGDLVCTPDGDTTQVIGVYPQGVKPVYKISFADGDFVWACGDHLWEVSSKKRHWQRSRLVDTSYLIKNLTHPCGQRVLSIRVPKPICMAERPIPIQAYAMGVLLGNGSLSQLHQARFSTSKAAIVATVEAGLESPYEIHSYGIEHEIVQRKREGNSSNHYIDALRSLKLNGHKAATKFVPDCYKYNSVEVRLDVLRGLFDTDASPVGTGCGIDYLTASRRLASDVKWLVESLGGICRITHKYSKKYKRYYYRGNIRVENTAQFFTLQEKIALCKQRTHYHTKRMIAAVEPVGEMPVQCIKVAGSAGLYLTDHCVVTHNTTMGLQLAIQGALHQHVMVGKKIYNELGHWYFFSYEAPVNPELRVRSISHAARIDRGRLEELYDWENQLCKEGMLEYERDLIYTGQNAAEAPTQTEYARFKTATAWMNKNVWLIDMTGATNPGIGIGGVQEICAILEYHTKVLGRKVAGVVIDWVGEAVDRYMVANNINLDKKRHYINRFVADTVPEIAGRFNCPTWVIHQLSGQANSRSATSAAHHTDASETKSFAVPLWFCFAFGTKDQATSCCLLSCTKQRRAAGLPDALIHINGRLSVLELAEGRYAYDPATRKIVNREDMKQIIVLNDTEATSVRHGYTGTIIR